MIAAPTRQLRAAEKLILAFFAYAVVASLAFPLAWRERVTVLGLNLLASVVVVALSRWGAPGRSPFFETVRDWLPCFLILVAYRESGLFFRPDPTHRLDYLFIRWDDALLRHPWTLAALEATAPWLQYYLELAYFLCYPVVPLGLGVFYLAGRRRAAATVAAGHDPAERDHGKDGTLDAVSNEASTPHAALTQRRYSSAIDHYWTALLLAAFVCYVLYPHFPLTPPRELFQDLPGSAVAPLLRKTNLWILNSYSVGACLFPSAHVASTLAAALVIRQYLPRVGVVFLVAAASIAVATVYGRYHYAADALAGALVGLAAFSISRRLFRTNVGPCREPSRGP